MNTALNNSNAVLCVWPATLIGEDNRADFEEWLQSEFNAHGEYVGEFKTLPDVKDDRVIEGTGGRNDALFWIASEDVSRFAVSRHGYGIRWWEDYAADSSAVIPQATRDEFDQCFVNQYDDGEME